MIAYSKLSKALNSDWEKFQSLTVVKKSIDIKAPIDTVFTYFARPEHVSDQMSDKGVGMTVIPMDINQMMMKTKRKKNFELLVISVVSDLNGIARQLNS